MDTASILVVIGGLAAIIFVLWWFFGAREEVRASSASGGAQELEIKVKGGYSPDVISARAGQPLRLHFYRDETSSCSEQVMFRDFGIARDLPAFKTTTIEFTPSEPGEYAFTCGMNMLRGRLIVR